MRSRRGLGVLAVCGLVLGMMAISASGAQAGTWMINKANVSGELKVEASVEIEPLGAANEKHLVLLTTSGANKIAILCTTTANASAVVTSTTITGTINISGCTTEINGKPEANCNPINQPVAAGGKITAVLHEKVAYARAEGEGGVFATFKFSEACLALVPVEKITGTGWLEDCLKLFETEESKHLIQEAMTPALALGGLKFGGNAAEIHGSIIVKLIDATHAGMTFSGLAE